MPPVERPLPRYVAEPPQEPVPYGRWGEALAERFLEAAREMDSDEPLGDPGELTWFPERSWGGRTYVPATCPTSNGFELFGFVSYTREHEGAQADDFAAVVDYTDETAEANPDWTLDLSDQEIAQWRGPEGRRGVVTLVWGVSHGGQRRRSHVGAGSHHHRPVPAGRGPLHARLPGRLHGRLRGGAPLRPPRHASWPASRCTRTTSSRRVYASRRAPIAQLDRATPS